MAVRYFGEHEPAAKRGLQVWMVLVAAAQVVSFSRRIP